MPVPVHFFDGHIELLYVHSGGCYIRLTEKGDVRPQDDYFSLLTSHQNYQSLYAVVCLAASNRYRVTIRTTHDINNGDQATVEYIKVYW